MSFSGDFFVQKVFVKENRLPLRIAFDYPFCSHFIHSSTAIAELVIWEVSLHVTGAERCHGFPLFYQILLVFHFWVTCEISQSDGLPSLRSIMTFVYVEMGIFFSAIIALKI